MPTRRGLGDEGECDASVRWFRRFGQAFNTDRVFGTHKSNRGADIDRNQEAPLTKPISLRSRSLWSRAKAAAKHWAADPGTFSSKLRSILRQRYLAFLARFVRCFS